jgi:hypothetical protein
VSLYLSDRTGNIIIGTVIKLPTPKINQANGHHLRVPLLEEFLVLGRKFSIVLLAM